jgi:hypothetical protein
MSSTTLKILRQVDPMKLWLRFVNKVFITLVMVFYGTGMIKIYLRNQCWNILDQLTKLLHSGMSTKTKSFLYAYIISLQWMASLTALKLIDGFDWIPGKWELMTW